jgi:hypothetical protein
MAIVATDVISFGDDEAHAYFDEDEPERGDIHCLPVRTIGAAAEDRRP